MGALTSAKNHAVATVGYVVYWNGIHSSAFRYLILVDILPNTSVTTILIASVMATLIFRLGLPLLGFEKTLKNGH